MNHTIGQVLTLVAASVLCAATAAIPKPEEFQDCKTWSDRVFAKRAEPRPAACLKLLYQDVQDPVWRGRSWRGTPFQLGDKVYTRGLAFGATKHILVHVGKPVRSFTAEIGLENNDDTRGGGGEGRGSVTFHVLAGGKELYASEVRRLKDGPLPMKVDLNGALEFEIRVKDGGDGRGWDQALWAEAAAALEDGTTVSLQDLPWEDSVARNPFGFSFDYHGAASAQLLGEWSRKTEEHVLDQRSSQRELTYLDPATGLEVQRRLKRFNHFAAV